MMHLQALVVNRKMMLARRLFEQNRQLLKKSILTVTKGYFSGTF
jgi:hypothetical protein